MRHSLNRTHGATRKPARRKKRARTHAAASQQAARVARPKESGFKFADTDVEFLKEMADDPPRRGHG